MKLLNKLKFAYLYDLKMEYKLLISHLTLSVLAILLLTALLYTNSARILERKLLNSAEATSEKITLSLENIIQKYDNMTYSFSMMETVTDIFSHPGPDYDYSGIRKDRTDFENAMFSCIPIQIRNSVTDCDIRVFLTILFPISIMQPDIPPIPPLKRRPGFSVFPLHITGTGLPFISFLQRTFRTRG